MLFQYPPNDCGVINHIGMWSKDRWYHWLLRVWRVEYLVNLVWSNLVLGEGWSKEKYFLPPLIGGKSIFTPPPYPTFLVEIKSTGVTVIAMRLQKSV